jgi:hypothetical protein
MIYKLRGIVKIVEVYIVNNLSNIQDPPQLTLKAQQYGEVVYPTGVPGS